MPRDTCKDSVTDNSYKTVHPIIPLKF